MTRSSIVSIRHLQYPESMAGTGFLIDTQHVLTCSYLLEQMGATTDSVVLVGLRPFITTKACIVHMRRGRHDDDVAVLQLEQPLAQTAVFPLTPLQKQTNEYQAAGWQTGADELQTFAVLADFHKARLPQKERFLAGAPLIDPETGGVVGLVQHVTAGKSDQRKAYAIPLEAIQKTVWPRLQIAAKRTGSVPSIPTLRAVPAGEFYRGSNIEDAGVHLNETPQSLQTLPLFFMSKHPITNSAYAAFVADTGYPPPPHWKDGHSEEPIATHPVVNVSHADAKAYCAWLSKKLNHPFRLPTEAEWEKAARGSVDGRFYSWGDAFSAYRCNTEENGRLQTTSVTEYEAEQGNPFGIADMLGNVWEWTASWFEKYEGTQSVSLNYGRSHRVVRGGSFRNDDSSCRVASRGRYLPETKRPYVGFRIASDVQLSAESRELIDGGKRPLPSYKFNIPKLRQKILDTFSYGELKIALTDMHLPAAEIVHTPSTLEQIVNDLLAYCERHGLQKQLYDYLVTKRETVDWKQFIIR